MGGEGGGLWPETGIFKLRNRKCQRRVSCASLESNLLHKGRGEEGVGISKNVSKWKIKGKNEGQGKTEIEKERKMKWI